MSKRLETLQKLLAKGSQDPFARYCIAMEYKSLGRLEDAARAFAELREFDASYVPQYLMAGGVLETLGNLEQARICYEEGFKRANEKRDAHAASELQQALQALQIVSGQSA